MGTKVRERPPIAARKPPAPPRTSLSQVVLLWLLAVGVAVLPVVGGRPGSPLALGAAGGLLLVFAAGVVFVLRRGQIPFRPHWLDVAMLIWVGIVFLSCLWSVNLHRSLLGLSLASCYLGVFFLGRWLAGREEGSRLLMAAAGAGAFVSAVIGLQSYLMNVVLLHNPEWRIFGPFINPNAFAGYLLVAGPALLFLGLCERSYVFRGCSWAALAVTVAALFLTGSKGGILAASAALALLSARLSAQARESRHRARLLTAFAAAVILLAAVVPPVRERLISAGAESHSALFRAYTWLGVMKMGAARPLLGWGIGSFDSVFGKFAVAGYTRTAHNDYLQMAAEAGLLGLASYLLALGGFLWLGCKAPKASGSEATLSLVSWAAVLGFCLHTLVDYDFPILATGATAWLFIGVGSTASRPTPGTERMPLRAVSKVALASLVGIGLVLAGYSLASAYAESQRQNAENRVNRGFVSLGVTQLRQAVRFAPLNAEAHRSLARALEAMHLRSGRTEYLERAQEEARAAVGWDRMRAVNWLLWGRLLAERGEGRLGDQEATAFLFEQATLLAPNDPHGWLVLAELRLRQAAMPGEWKAFRQRCEAKALSALERIEQIEKTPAAKVKAIPDLVDLDFARARLYLSRRALQHGQPLEVLASAQRTLEEIGQYRSSKSVAALRAIGEEPYPAVERLEAMALLLRADARERLRQREGAEKDRRAALQAWASAPEAFRSFLEGGMLP